MSQHARHHPSSLRLASSIEPLTHESRICAHEATSGTVSFVLSAGPSQQRPENQSQVGASQGSARAKKSLETISLSFRRRAVSQGFGKLGQRRREKTVNSFNTPRLVAVMQGASGPAPGFAVRPNYIVQPGPATAGVASPVRACRSMVADRACNARLRGPG
jgi:hypothetical protein